MISLFLACCGITQQPSAKQPDAAALVGKMFSYYANATSMTGKIRMTQQAQNITDTIVTDLAFEAPSKIFVRQVLSSPSTSDHSYRANVWMVTSDGKDFTYDFPNEQRLNSNKPEPSRMHEFVNGVNGPLGFRDIFRAAYRSLGDLSIPELVAIGGTRNFRAVRDEIATIDYVGSANVAGTPVMEVRGMWRPAAESVPTAVYEIYISADGQLKRYRQDEKVSVKMPDAKMGTEDIVTTWDVDLNVNAKPDESLFSVATAGQ